MGFYTARIQGKHTLKYKMRRTKTSLFYSARIQNLRLWYKLLQIRISLYTNNYKPVQNLPDKCLTVKVTISDSWTNEEFKKMCDV